MENEIEKRKREIIILQKNQGYGTCYKCGLPWNECESKPISDSDRSAIFALCKYCWDNSSLEERLHHYKDLWLEHTTRWGHEMDWNRIETEINKLSKMLKK